MDGVLERAPVKRVAEALEHFGIKGKIHVLADSARTAVQAAEALGIEVGQIASSLIFKLPDSKALLVITSGRHRVDTDLVASQLGIEKLERADAYYVKEISGFSVGGVSPFAWTNPPSEILIDQALEDYEVVWAAGGHPHAVFPTTFTDLLRVTGGQKALVSNQ